MHAKLVEILEEKKIEVKRLKKVLVPHRQNTLWAGRVTSKKR
jgi:hypothetical protein